MLTAETVTRAKLSLLVCLIDFLRKNKLWRNDEDL